MKGQNFKYKLNTINHLYSPPLYVDIDDRQWTDDYSKIIRSSENLTLDLTAITSFLSVGQFSRNRTLFNEVKRLPWFAEPLETGEYKEIEIPRHNFKTGSDAYLAKIFFEKLCDEAREVIKHSSEIYILLTGGLDSRIVAGVYSYLYKNGELIEKPKCLTWGIENSRDVHYARIMADKLNFEWEHIPLGPETVMENIQKCGEYLGLLHSPEMLHSMLWFKNLSPEAIVIAGSFGDSMGRGEFSSLHLLQLDYKEPKNTYNILVPSAYSKGSKELKQDIEHIHLRGGKDTLKYMQCEYWMQGYRMRNGLCHALSVINRFANVYQMFTSRQVCEFIWSLHPSRRDDNIYFNLLRTYFPHLAGVPWARDNKAIIGNYRERELLPHYHEYTKWSSGVLYDDISTLVDPDWFAETGLFNKKSIKELNAMVLKSHERVGRLNDIWLWLAGFRYYMDELDREGKIVTFSFIPKNKDEELKSEKINLKKHAVLLASNSKTIHTVAKKMRKKYREIDLRSKKKEMLKKYPPISYEI